ncbi:MAG: monovalent cation/H+ antiporter complex subunit F [Actinomycetota bacterium]
MIVTFAFTAFGLTFVAAGWRAIRGPGIADRVAALDVAVTSLMGAVAVETARTGSLVLLPIVAVLAIVGFTATVAASRFIERYGETTT